jgi:hypothetical protein
VNWTLAIICGLAAIALIGRSVALGGRTPPRRFWLGLTLLAPILTGTWLPYAESWHSVLAAWGLWLCIDGITESCGRPSLLGDQPGAAVWAVVISIFGWAGVEQLNEYFPVWTSLGFSFNPLAREVAVGLLGGPVVPTVLSVAAIVAPASVDPPRGGHDALGRVSGSALIAFTWLTSDSMDVTAALICFVVGAALVLAPRHVWPGAARLESLIVGALVWAAFDTLWSQLGPAQRFFVDFSSPSLLPVALAVCALMLASIYQSAVDVLDKPSFNPFERG